MRIIFIALWIASALANSQTPLFTARGAIDRDYAGEAIALVGDLNGDLVEDWVFAEMGFDGQAGLDTGRITAVSGRDASVIYRVEGSRAGDSIGSALCRADDYDGDGTRDWIVGAPFGGPNGANSGHVEIRSGRTGALIRNHLGSGDTNGDGFGSSYGWVVAECEDVDGDGMGDYLIGAPGDLFDPLGCIAVDQPGSFEVRSGRTGALLFQINGVPNCLNAGAAAAGLGDLNNDGFAEFLLGFPEASSLNGRIEVRDGRTGNRLRLHGGLNAGDFFGGWVAELGDLDGDGIAEYGGGADNRSGAGQSFGAGYVLIFSGRTGQLITRLDGRSRGDSFGRGFGDARDQTGDGVPDIYVSAPYDDVGGTDAGRIVLFDGASFTPIREVLGEQVEDFIGFGPRSMMVPDLDGDGLWEIAGSTWANDRFGTNRGIVQVFGSQCRSHYLSQNLVSIANPGRVLFEVDGGFAFANGVYGVAASLTGATPGTTFGGLTLPLTNDLWFSLCLAPQTTPFANGIGNLGPTGRATAFFDVPAGLGPIAINQSHWSAAVLISATGTIEVSGAEVFTLLP